MNPRIQIENLTLKFKTDYYRPSSWRDLFVETAGQILRKSSARGELRPVLSDVSFEATAGDKIGIIGVNGVGKTSLCRCIAGNYRPTSGKITLVGKIRAIFDSSVGMLPELTGRENARLLVEFLYPDICDKDKLLNQSFEFSELGAALDTPFKNYSNGMKSRLCLSIISSQPAEILILDEVFEGADVFFSEKISRRILDIIEESGIVIFVSHSPENIRRVCNRVILLDQGRISYDGPVEEALRAYGAPFSTVSNSADSNSSLHTPSEPPEDNRVLDPRPCRVEQLLEAGGKAILAWDNYFPRPRHFVPTSHSVHPSPTLTPKAIAQILVNKFEYHFDLNVQRLFAPKMAANLSEETIDESCEAAKKALSSILPKIEEEIFSNRGVVHIGVVPWRIANLEAVWRLWVVSNTRSVYYAVDSECSNEFLENLTKHFQGSIVCTSQPIFDTLRQKESIRIQHCWVSLLREFREAEYQHSEAAEAISIIDRLLKSNLEEQAKSNVSVTQGRTCQPLVEEFHTWCKAREEAFGQDTKLGALIRKSLLFWNNLTLFLNDPTLPLTNLDYEEALYLITTGRPPLLSSSSCEEANRVAFFSSIVETCRRHQVDSVLYLSSLLERSSANEECFTPSVFSQQTSSNLSSQSINPIAGRKKMVHNSNLIGS